MKKRLRFIALSMTVVFGMTNTAALAAVSGGSVGSGNISVMQGGKVVDKLSGQNPLQDESLMVCDGKCMVKSAGVSLTAADQAKFAIKNETDTFRLFLRAGSIDFVITDKARKIAFHTPEGVYSVAEMIFNAASNPAVRGTVMVNTEGKTEISLKEGRMSFATADGVKTVGSNEKIVLAMAEVKEKCNDKDTRTDNDCCNDKDERTDNNCCDDKDNRNDNDCKFVYFLGGIPSASSVAAGGAAAAGGGLLVAGGLAAAAVVAGAVAVNNNNDDAPPRPCLHPSPNI